MTNLYIGGRKNSKRSKWIIYSFLVMTLAITILALKATGPVIVEKWINRMGADEIYGHAFSVRDVEISLGKGEFALKDVKVFNSKTNIEILQSPEMKIQLNWSDLIMSQEKRVAIIADQVDLIISKDLTAKIERIQKIGEKNDLYLTSIDGKIAKLNIIEKKKDMSRTVLEMNEATLKVKEVSTLAINEKTEFVVASNLATGGKFTLNGKLNQEKNWNIQGTLDQVSSEIFNKIAGDKLPFTFNEPRLNAQITAQSNDGVVSGEILPEIRKLNLIDERPGYPVQSIARILSEDLEFTLPFTLKNKLTFHYADTYKKLKTYRKYPMASEAPEATEPKVTQTQSEKSKEKGFSLWPF